MDYVAGDGSGYSRTREEDKMKDNPFNQAIAHVRVALATHKMKSKRDIGSYLGVSLEDVALGKGMDDELSVTLFNSIIVPYLEKKHVEGGQVEKSSSASGSVPSSSSSAIDEVTSVYEKHPLDDTGWSPAPNPKQTAVPYPFQTKAAKDMVYRLFIEKKRACLLRASVGTGKTYMFGQFLRWCFDKQAEVFAGCISPWPALITTKATVVEQTRRVMVDEFGLDPHRQVFVMAYDSLRSGKGTDTMIEEEVEVRNGEKEVHRRWKPWLRPRILIIDECQAAKNWGSQQSEIVSNLSELRDEAVHPVKIVFSSATPFTTITESRYLCINAGIPYRIV